MRFLKTIIVMACLTTSGCSTNSENLVQPYQTEQSVKALQPTQTEKMKIIETTVTKTKSDGTPYQIQEYKFQGKILHLIARCRSDGPCVMEFDGIAVNFGPYINTFLYKQYGGGGVEWLKSIGTNRDKYIGMEAEVSCHISPFARSNTWKNQNGEIVKLCIPRNDPKYYVRFNQ